MSSHQYNDIGPAWGLSGLPKLNGMPPLRVATDLNAERAKAAKRRQGELLAEVNEERILTRVRHKFLSYVSRQAFWMKYGDVIMCLIVLAIAIVVFTWMLTGGLSPWIK